MSGTLLAYPTNGAANWEAFPDIVQRLALGFMGLRLSNMANFSSEPQIEAGSVVEVAGGIYQFTNNESISGWSGIANDSDVYIKLVPSGSSITAVFVTAAPTWSVAKVGWYDVNDRYIGGLYKYTSGGDYKLKWMYPSRCDDPVNQEMFRAGAARPLIDYVLQIGDWDMYNVTGSDTKSVNHYLKYKFRNVRKVGIVIRPDTDALLDPVSPNKDATTFHQCQWTYMDDNIIRLNRLTGGSFDNTTYDQTSYNRGFITLQLRA